MKKKLSIIALLCAFACTSVQSAQYSKLSVISSAKRIGRWQALKSWIATADLEDEWKACQYLSDDYPQFQAVTNAIVSAGLASSDEVAFILTNSVDTAVADTFLRRVYDNDMRTTSGRSKWHGRLVREIVDTNALVKVTLYEDGTTFREEAKVIDPNASVKKSNARLRTVMTNGVPAKLAEARIRRSEEIVQGVSNVTVTVTAGR